MIEGDRNFLRFHVTANIGLRFVGRLIGRYVKRQTHSNQQRAPALWSGARVKRKDCYARLIAQQIRNAITLFEQFVQRAGHLFARESVDFQAFYTLVFAVFARHGNAVDDVFRDFV